MYNVRICSDTFANKTSLPSIIPLLMSAEQRWISHTHSIKSDFWEVQGLRTSECVVLVARCAYNNKLSLPSFARLQTNTVARRISHRRSLKHAFREEQGLWNSKLLNIAYCWRAKYIYQLNIFTLARSPPNEHSGKKMQYLTLTEFGV